MKRIKVIRKIKEMQQISEQLRKKGMLIAFVPTMGYLHEGHLSLFRKGKQLGDVLVISIFVNPIQFNQREDFEKYPRDEKRDIELARSHGADIAFIPNAEDMYPEGFQTHVEVEKLTQPLCGSFRPGHFTGVTTVVAKLFNIVKPHIAIFGEKDYQQLKVIQRMVKDLNFDIKIIPGKTVREKDGLAMSSRNARLSPDERKKAITISKALKRAKSLFDAGENDASRILGAAKEILQNEPAIRIEYLNLVDPETLEDLQEVKKEGLIAIACWLGNVRLIDNIKLGR